MLIPVIRVKDKMTGTTETEDGEMVAEITQDEITVMDGYIATLMQTEVRA